jgi:hypothetical protein
MPTRQHYSARMLYRASIPAPSRHFLDRLARRVAELGGTVESIRRHAAVPVLLLTMPDLAR